MARQQQISFFGGLRPTGVDQTAGLRLKALAGITEQVGDIAFKAGAKQRTKAGQLAGAQAVERDEEGKIIAPELESDFTIFGQNFNQASILAHRAQIGIDTKEELDRIQNENRLDPQAFKSAAAGSRAGLIKGMPEELAVIVGSDFDSSVSSRLSQLNKSFFARENDKNKATFRAGVESATDDLLNAAREGDDERQISLLIENNASIDEAVNLGLLSAVEAVQIKERTLERITQQKTLRQVDEIVFNEDLTLEEQAIKGTEFIESLRKSKLEDLSPEQKDSLVSVVERRVNDVFQNIRSKKNQRDLEKEKVISDLKVAAALAQEQAKDGLLTDLTSLTEQTEQLHSNGEITESERTSIKTKIAKASAEIDRITLADKRIIARLLGDESVTMNKQNIDSFYKRNLQDDIDSLDPAVATAKKADFISLTRTVPSQVKQEITNGILSGDPDLILQSADLVDRIDEIPGMTELAVDANQRAFINNVVALSANMEPEAAVKLARELSDPRDSARINAREELIKSKNMRDDYADDVEDAFDSFLGGELQDNVNLQEVTKEYQDLFESFYKAGTSKEASEQKAIDILQANWKDSQFGFMKHPPETFYNVNGDTDYIKDQLVKDLTSGTIGLEINRDNVFLISDETTDRGASQGNPSYRMMVIDENGTMTAPVLTDENGNPSNRWVPDRDAEKALQDDIKLRENRELLRSRRRKNLDVKAATGFTRKL